MLNIGTLQLPPESATKTFAILAKRGAGKTYTAGVLAEEMFRNNIPIVVFDPIDVWYGLRFSADGTKKGLPIVVFGIENSDIPLNRDMGKKIAQAIVKKNVSCVISTFGLPKVAQRHLITEFSEELMRINNSPRHIFIEESHEYVPQRIGKDNGKCFNAVSQLIIMGRNRGLGVTLINQRAATINKDVLTQLDTLLAFRNVSPQDKKALREWVEHHSAEGDFENFWNSLPNLPNGEGWIWSPEFLSIFKRIKIRKRETFHPDREKLGFNFKKPELDKVDVSKFVEDFMTSGEITGKEDAKDKAGKETAELKKKISELERELHIAKQARQTTPVQDTGLKRQLVELDRENRELKKRIAGVHPKAKILADNLYRQLLTIKKEAEAFAEKIKKDCEYVRGYIDKIIDGKITITSKNQNGTQRVSPADFGRRFESMAKKQRAEYGIGKGYSETNSSLGKCERAILTALAQRNKPSNKNQIAVLTGYAVTSGSFNNALSKLRTSQYIDGVGDNIRLTSDGMEALGRYEPLPTGEALHQYWYRNLGKCESAILKFLIDNNDDSDSFTKLDIASATNYEPTSGSFNNALSKLRTLELIEGYGEIRASINLFVE